MGSVLLLVQLLFLKRFTIVVIIAVVSLSPVLKTTGSLVARLQDRFGKAKHDTGSCVRSAGVVGSLCTKMATPAAVQWIGSFDRVDGRAVLLYVGTLRTKWQHWLQCSGLACIWVNYLVFDHLCLSGDLQWPHLPIGASFASRRYNVLNLCLLVRSCAVRAAGMSLQMSTVFHVPPMHFSQSGGHPGGVFRGGI
ncbi:hypothetical protein GOP47_0007375 [Adiantum capillus-veneris]|uniref:Uncharacterized protein n=1 Tax=Adiantum capillus-veneris TaxID=13818 RepID=A0A9D4V0K0_ADICA|nr:hypothetical protein GOP47_0007375 [Adiantum capillus-veneris]